MTRPANATLPPGTRLNRYRIDKRLAAGGFGVVYVGTRDDGRQVAIKEFLPQVIACRPAGKTRIDIADAYDADRFTAGLAAFFQEADVLSRIHDDRIIAIWDVFESHGTAYFAMPLEKGHTLHALVRQDQDVPDATARRLFVEAAKGVEVLHAHRLLHLDLKPGNLWVRPDGAVVVLDLGASRWSDQEGRSVSLARTPGFAAPEQHTSLKRRAELTEQTDIYGLAASLRATLEGTSPPAATQRQPDEGMACRWQGQRDPGLMAVVDRGMAVDPAHRYPTVAAFRQALQALPRLPDHLDRPDGL